MNCKNIQKDGMRTLSQVDVQRLNGILYNCENVRTFINMKKPHKILVWLIKIKLKYAVSYCLYKILKHIKSY